jgi:signal transduction histidine kinase
MLPVYVVLLTPDCRVKFANKFFRERFGDLNGKRRFAFLTGRGEPCETFKPVTTNKPHHWERIGSDNRHYDIYDFPFVDVDGSPLIMEMGIDITERKQAETALSDAKEMKLLGQLTAGVAHEVRNPLNGILAIMGALSKELSNDDRFEPYMKHMRNQVTRLSVLMEELLCLGRPIHEKDRHAISLTTIVEKNLATWQQTLVSPKSPVRFIKPETTEPYTVNADTTSMSQVIINLLENASNHSPTGTEITCSVGEQNNEMVVFSVKDRGPGIPEGILQRIFDPFFTTRKGGTGLGLSIVHHIVENHQGTITACNNTDGPGATFEVRLPRCVKQPSPK